MRIIFNSTISNSFVHSMGRKKSFGFAGKYRQKYITESCYKLSNFLQMPAAMLINLTKDSDIKRFSFLKNMVNTTVSKGSQGKNSKHILNIFSMVQEPTQTHFNIVAKTNDSFESLEKIFSLAQDEKSLEFVENLQYDILKNKNNVSQVIIDLLTSKYRTKYVDKLSAISSYLKLHGDEENSVAKLDELVETGKFSRLRYDAELAIKGLMKNKAINVAMAGKTTALEQAYTKERGNFLQAVVNYFIPKRKTPSDATQNVVVDMYKTLDAKNLKLRKAVMDRFKYTAVKDKASELKEMQILFDRMDADEEARKFVQKSINRDLKVKSITELNEVLNAVPLKKANVFFSNAQRIIELSNGKERNAALVNELENPFFVPQHSIKYTGLYSPSYDNDGIIMKAARMVENQINKFRYYHLAA